MFGCANYRREFILMLLMTSTKEEKRFESSGLFCCCFLEGKRSKPLRPFEWNDAKGKRICSHERENCCVSNEHHCSADWCFSEKLRCNWHKWCVLISWMHHFYVKNGRSGAHASRVSFNWIRFCRFPSLVRICIIAMPSPACDDESSTHSCSSLSYFTWFMLIVLLRKMFD